MKPNTVRALVALSLLVVALAAAFVEQRWLRALLVLVPAVFLAQKALLRATPATVVEPVEPPPEEDRRTDMTIRRHFRQLLELIREFYSTCHMVAVGQLSPSKAKSKAREVEEKLDIMMNEMLARIDADPEGETGRDVDTTGDIDSTRAQEETR